MNAKRINAKGLPRLLYVGDVPVASTVAGAALLYRLLQPYPASHLRIVEGNLWSSQQLWSSPEKRLPHVHYDTLHVGMYRFLCSRLSPFYVFYLQLTAPLRSRKLFKIVNDFKPEAILTVAHGFSWLTASALAKHYKLPLHLIVHDDWLSTNPLPRCLQQWVYLQLGRVYRQAQNQFCASPYMVKAYKEHFGITGNVLYPSRAMDGVELDSLSVVDRDTNTSLVFAYAGTINSQGYADGLSMLAGALEKVGGQLVIYSSLSDEAIKRLSLNQKNIIVRPIIPYKELYKTLRSSADVLFVPMSFEVGERHNMELGFPSKLTDYTAVGLPLLIWGPPYCSAVTWANENPGVAEIVQEKSSEALAKAVVRLAEDPQYRAQLGNNAMAKGMEFFSHSAATRQFYQSILNTY